jgi:hypothetical protein
MLKINRKEKSFSALETPTLTDVSITERYDLQEFISNSPTGFFTEIGQDLFLLGKEVTPSKDVQDRIDLLAVDREGTCTVIELKRGNHKLQMLQAISYAGMISQWPPEDFLQLLDEDQQEALADFLEVDREEINRQQKIILIAEQYDYALLIGAQWLSEQFGVDITCCRIAVAKDVTTNTEYLVCSNVFPAPELAHEAIKRGGKRGISKVKWDGWESALAEISNSAVVTYFKQELSLGRENYLRRRILHYLESGKRRWFMAARQKNAYVWQNARFPGDIEFWQKGLSHPAEVKPVKEGQCLRLFLYTSADFEFFRKSATKTLQSTQWLSTSVDDEMEEAVAGEPIVK